MYFWELSSQFLREMRTRKLRTTLALFCIAWGTVAVVLLLSIGGGFHRASSKAMHGMGDSIVVVWPGRTTKAFAGMQPGRQLSLKADDVIKMGRALPEIAHASPELIRDELTLRFGKHRTKSSVAGVVPAYEHMRNMIPAEGGRFLHPLDVDERRRTIFIGYKIKEKLFGDEAAVGQTIQVDGRPFLVVGTLAPKLQTSNYAGQDADRAYIPYSTFIATWGNQNVNNILLSPEPADASAAMTKAVYTYLGQQYRFDPDDEGALGIWDTVEMDRFTNFFFWGLQAFLGLGGALTLGAGGIGVANIMFLIVRERTREIGVRMAVGARDAHIMGQVLLEALLIVTIGGLLGFSFSAAVITAIQLAPTPDWLGTPEISPLIGAATLSILALVGLCAGLFPARRAARMNPVRALEF